MINFKMSNNSTACSVLSRGPAVAIVIITVLSVYAQTCFFEYTNWDDKPFILDNLYLQSPTLENLFNLIVPGQITGELLYLPITYLSFWIESSVFGLNPHISHSINLALHLTNAILVLVILNSWLNNRFASLLATLFFAIHPLQVESVAWVMGRKDLLSTLFALITVIFYQKYLSAASIRHYLISLLCFICASLAKPTMIVVPALLLLITYLRPKQAVHFKLRPLLPLLLIAALIFLINRSISEPFETPSIHLLGLRLAFLPVVVFGWLKRLVFLEQPQVIYAFSDANIDEISLLGYAPILLTFAVLLWSIQTKRTWIWFGIVFTTLAFLPAASIIFQNSREFITADRYGYFPMIGVCYLLVTPLRKAMPSLVKRGYQIIICAGIVLAIYTARERVKIWADSESLWIHVLNTQEDTAIAANLLGNHFYETKRKAAAISQYTAAARMKPGHVRAYYNLGRTYSDSGQIDRAIKAYKRALISNPEFLEARFNLGVLLFRRNAFDAALSRFSEVIEKDPNYVDAYYSSGLIHKKRNQPRKAIAAFSDALIIAPRHQQARFKLGVVYHSIGKINEALAEYDKLLLINPDHDKTLYNAGLICLTLERYEDAARHLRKVLQAGVSVDEGIILKLRERGVLEEMP